MQLLVSNLEAKRPVTWLRERDIDLLVCSELYARGSLSDWLGMQLGATPGSFAKALVSHAEVDGETDLVVIFDAGGHCTLGLIENKIDAAFQPNQVTRYAARRERWRKMANVERVQSVIIAPQAYLSHAGCELFDLRIAYEELCSVLRSCSDGRSAFLADVLEAGIEAYRRGYVMVPDELSSAIWNASWQQSCNITPKLNFPPPGEKPGKSTWFYFREPYGFDKNDRGRICIVLKADRGQADLQFSATSAAELARRARELTHNDMRIVSASKSSSIRITVPQISFTTPPSGQEDSIRAGLYACERLRAFYIEHRNILGAWR
ncbi:hypothetical protein [Muricoccus pecuniae]|uniref:PD-(D/E)XK nuclease superfamily protein n=1 Tax=Muricoccus pecuniae TaxID=693023 RepID=A0A840YFL8_9PROT|nr:hypothetical protein [Roseomonas pecuniae]MBB5695137.1 hypothetical protein [Roseomonas pecuniae]